MTTHYDILIVGGGLAGNSIALMLAHLNCRIGIIEAKNIDLPITDHRSFVLSHTSQLIFQALNSWQDIMTQAYPLQDIHVSDRGHFGAARFSAKKLGIPALGYIVPAHHLTNLLAKKVREKSQIDFISPAKVIALQYADNLSKITLQTQNGNEVITAKLVIAADGSTSLIRNLLKIETYLHDYQQSAVVTLVETKQNHNHVAYERLTSTGPLAFLPRDKNVCAVVWAVTNDQADRLLHLDKLNFLTELQQAFGYRLGKLMAVGEREAYSLKLIYAKEKIRPGCVLIGNAAQTLHPVAGQGFNLALRDAAALAQIIIEAFQNQKNPGSLDVLQFYEKWRSQDQFNVIHFTDKIIKFFSNSWLLPARTLGLAAIDAMPFFKKALIRRLLGLKGYAPRLVCGVSLEEIR